MAIQTIYWHAIKKSYEVLYKYYTQGDNFRFIIARFVHVAFLAVGVPYFFLFNQQFFSETRQSPLKRESITRYIGWTGVTFYTIQKGSFTRSHNGYQENQRTTPFLK